jgi:hypothetical protein
MKRGLQTASFIKYLDHETNDGKGRIHIACMGEVRDECNILTVNCQG